MKEKELGSAIQGWRGSNRELGLNGEILGAGANLSFLWAFVQRAENDGFIVWHEGQGHGSCFPGIMLHSVWATKG